jgi:hypothetical protein
MIGCDAEDGIDSWGRRIQRQSRAICCHGLRRMAGNEARRKGHTQDLK